MSEVLHVVNFGDNEINNKSLQYTFNIVQHNVICWD